MPATLPTSPALVPCDLEDHLLDVKREAKRARTRKRGLLVVLMMAPGLFVSPLWLKSRTKQKRTCASWEMRCIESCDTPARGPERVVQRCVDRCLPAMCR